MVNKLSVIIILFIPCLIGCNQISILEVENKNRDKLQARYKLEEVGEKIFVLDSLSTPRPKYMQLFSEPGKSRSFTFLNTYNKSIYFYDYDNERFSKVITLKKLSQSGVNSPAAYHIQGLDSIYIYNMPLTEVVFTNQAGGINKTVSLRGEIGNANWSGYYPQYNPSTANPFIHLPGKLLFTGQYFFSIPETVLDVFKFTSEINTATGEVKFMHTYPKSLYGSAYNWEGGMFTRVFSELHPDGDKLIYSFPVDHNLYLIGLNSNTYSVVYGGSNHAQTINSIPTAINKTSDEMTLTHYAQENSYTAIKYDKYNKVYYRFFLGALPKTDGQKDKLKKPITIIILDEKFNYLGESTIGTGEEFQWSNSFVTKEGLNIEFTGKILDEDNLKLKIFKLTKLK